uniref:Rep-like protein n=1 Tax=Zymomonas mobilis subsp. mobilis (strain ATCC 10988 / DSM 424 / LMG 404 / NCIMB 8938 / NRRL B-806 / ZM1) TaxID=555217 RepID=Q9S1D1_ZYMMA|nr:protein rep [Zymomonas mobilis]CAB51899.1 Rep-like protein [Zymomonas mobilis subsp. mobilis ATCC 10988]
MGLRIIVSKADSGMLHRSQADDVQKIYNQELEFQRLAQRIGNCSGILRFSQIDDDETGKKKLKLRLQEAHFCRVRHCPVCQWRRSLMWQARFYSALPAIIKEYPKARFLFLTLTVKNCHIEDLSDTLRIMNSGWQRLRLKDRKEFKWLLGWIRSTEVTKGKDGLTSSFSYFAYGSSQLVCSFLR